MTNSEIIVKNVILSPDLLRQFDNEIQQGRVSDTKVSGDETPSNMYSFEAH